MQGARGGYTIIEVLIVLAVTGALFVSAVTVFQGKQGRTQFSQAMRDVDSKIQSFVNDSDVNSLPGTGLYKCTAPGPSYRPVLANSAVDTTGTNDGCIFLGRALQVVNNGGSGKIFAYAVLGRRVDTSGPSQVTVQDLASANPEPAMGPPPPSQPDLTEQYNLLYGATFVYARASTNSSPPPLTKTDMVGYYNSPQSVSGSSKPILTTLGYTGFTSDPITPRNGVQAALRNSVIGPTLAAIQGWYVCIQSGSSNEQSLLIISSSSAGVSTKISYGICP